MTKFLVPSSEFRVPPARAGLVGCFARNQEPGTRNRRVVAG
jgi:hypothetical protein